MNRRPWLVAILLLLAPTVSIAADDVPPTVRDLYVGCYLFVNGGKLSEESEAKPYSEAACLSETIVISLERGGQSESKSNRWRFCVPPTVEIATNPERAMAYAFLEYVEANPLFLTKSDGRATFIIAMARKWPCQEPAK